MLDHSADGASFLYSLRDILCTIFGKEIDWVRSGHGVITSEMKQPPTDFSPKSSFQQPDLLSLARTETLYVV